MTAWWVNLIGNNFKTRYRVLHLMPKSMLRSYEQPTNERDQAVIACALRTLEAETGGLTALSIAIANGLGRAFITAISMIGAARRNAGLDRLAGALRPPGRGEPWRSRHDYLGRRHHCDVVVG